VRPAVAWSSHLWSGSVDAKIAAVFRTLILGRSNLGFTEPGLEDASTPALLQGYLRAAAPAFEHELLTETLFFGERMAERAAQCIDKHQADATFVQIGTGSLEQDSVVFAIRRRWPKLYPAALAAAQKLKVASGGGPDGGYGLRGSLFRIPRALAGAAFGAEPGDQMDMALRSTKETIDALSRFENRGVAIQLLPIVHPRPVPVVEERVRFFTRELRDHCNARRIPLLSRFDYHRDLGIEPQASGYGLYPGRRTRETDARVMAGFILEAAGLQAGPPVR